MNPAKTYQPPHKSLKHNKMATSLLRSCRGSHPSIVFPREYSHQHVSREKETDGDPPQQGSAASHRGGQTHTVPVWKACNGPQQVCEILEEDCLPTDKQQPKTLSSSTATPTIQLPMGVVPSKETAVAEKGAIAGKQKYPPRDCRTHTRTHNTQICVCIPRTCTWAVCPGKHFTIFLTHAQSKPCKAEELRMYWM